MKKASKLKTINHRTSIREIRKRFIGRYLYTDGFRSECVVSETEINLDSSLLSNLMGIRAGFVIQEVNKLNEYGKPYGLKFAAVSQDSSLYGCIGILTGSTSRIPRLNRSWEWCRIVFLLKEE